MVTLTSYLLPCYILPLTSYLLPLTTLTSYRLDQLAQTRGLPGDGGITRGGCEELAHFGRHASCLRNTSVELLLHMGYVKLAAASPLSLPFLTPCGSSSQSCPTGIFMETFLMTDTTGFALRMGKLAALLPVDPFVAKLSAPQTLHLL